MHISILTFDGFNELDSLVALGILNRIKKRNWRVTLSCPTPTVTSMNGVTLHAQSTLAEDCLADTLICSIKRSMQMAILRPQVVASPPSIWQLGSLHDLKALRLPNQRCTTLRQLAKRNYTRIAQWRISPHICKRNPAISCGMDDSHQPCSAS